MSAPRDAGDHDTQAPSSASGGDTRTLVAHMRHELRTSLTAVLGYGDFLLDSVAKSGPPDMHRSLEAMKGAGDAMLVLIDTHLDTTLFGASAPESDALPRILRELSDACRGPVGVIAEACTAVIAIAEREGMYSVVPVVCKIQAAGVMLEDLLRTYSTEGSSGSLASAAPVILTPPPSSSTARAFASVSPAGDRVGRVLVVDDNSINRDLLRQWLERQGHTVEEATGGQLALDRIRSEDYDVILLDLRMPDLNGMEVLQILQDEGRLGRVPIVVLSASDEMDGVIQCIERGADDYLLKPFNTVLLRARIRLSMELKRHRDLERAYLAAALGGKASPGGA